MTNLICGAIVIFCAAMAAVPTIIAGWGLEEINEEI